MSRLKSRSLCNGIRGVKAHNEVDIKNPYGSPIYVVKSGTATLHTEEDPGTGEITGAGHYMKIKSVINGDIVEILYFHMQQNGRVSGTVNAGDIIGYQGDSGNLKAAIEQKLSVSHLHLKARENGQKRDLLNYLATNIDPNTGLVTNPCQ